MSISFNDKELSLITEREWFLVKSMAGNKMVSLFTGLADQLIPELKPPFYGTSFKVTKGDNLNGFPYFVLDIPKMSAEVSLSTLRIISWWGNYSSINILIGPEQFNLYKERIFSKLLLLNGKGFFYSVIDDFWKHDIYDRNFYHPVEELNRESWENLKQFKLSCALPLQNINNLGNDAELKLRELMKLFE
jgi:hypothetical protein